MLNYHQRVNLMFSDQPRGTIYVFDVWIFEREHLQPESNHNWDVTYSTGWGDESRCGTVTLPSGDSWKVKVVLCSPHISREGLKINNTILGLTLGQWLAEVALVGHRSVSSFIRPAKNPKWFKHEAGDRSWRPHTLLPIRWFCTTEHGPRDTHTRTNIANAFVCPENIELRQNKSHPDPLHFPVFVCFCVLFIFTLNSAWITWKILTAEALQTSFYQSCLLRLHPLSSVKIWGNMINSPRGEKQATKGTQEKIW